MARPFRLDCQAVEHAGLADREVANVDHLLHFTLAFRDDFSGLKRHELTKLRFQIAQCVTQTANSLATHRRWRGAPF